MRACIMALLQEYQALDCFKTTVNVNNVNNRISDSKGKMSETAVSACSLCLRGPRKTVPASSGSLGLQMPYSNPYPVGTLPSSSSEYLDSKSPLVELQVTGLELILSMRSIDLLYQQSPCIQMKSHPQITGIQISTWSSRQCYSI